MTQTWWLSFVDPDRPEGDRFLGVVIVDVTEADAAAAHETDPQEGTGRELDWIAAAVRQAEVTSCHPGGIVGAARLDTMPGYPTRGVTLPRNQLLSRAQIEALGLTPGIDS